MRAKSYAKDIGSNRLRRRWRQRFGRIADRLVMCYGLPQLPDLGNLADPVDEIFFIVLSAKTNEKLYMKAFSRLKERLPTLEAIASASTGQIAKCVACAGLGNKRAKQVKSIAKRLLIDLRPEPAERLRSMSDTEAFDYLTSLDGVGPKSAFCVMTMSLGKNAFPVDVNVHRVARRLGILPHGLKHYQAQAQLPQFVPKRRAKELHVGLVIHGRRVCLPRIPRCGECVLRPLCAFPKEGRAVLETG